MGLEKYSDYFTYTDPKEYAKEENLTPGYIHNMTWLLINDEPCFEEVMEVIKEHNLDMAQTIMHEVCCNIANI